MIDGRVVDKPVDHASRGRLRALYEWLKPAMLEGARLEIDSVRAQ